MIHPFYTFKPETVAIWLEAQGKDVYWSVDGDPELGGRLSFPCPASELADELRKIGGELFVHDRIHRNYVHGYTISLSMLIDTEELGVPSLAMKWRGDEDCVDYWFMIQDMETTEAVRREEAEIISEKKRKIKKKLQVLAYVGNEPIHYTFGPFEERSTAETCVLNLSCRENVHEACIVEEEDDK